MTAVWREKDYNFGFVCFSCGKYAFYYNHKPTTGESLDPFDALWKGHHPELGSDITCQECGYKIPKIELIPKNVIKIEKEEIV